MGLINRIQTLISNPLSLLYALVGVLIGLTVHEWAHAFSANLLGDPTAKNLGRMTLNPLAHIDPIGFASMILIGLGWAKPVPVNPRNFKNFRRDDIIVSLAGIVMNLITAFVATLVYVGLIVKKPALLMNEAFRSIVGGIISMNLALAVFNILPLYPLDGSHVFESLFMKRIPKVCFFLRQYARYILIVILLTGVASSLFTSVVNWIYSGFFSVAFRIFGIG